MRRLQIGVMGSAADLRYSKDAEMVAEELGYNIAKNNAVLFFGAEKDYDSLSTAACRGAKRGEGLTVGVTYEKGKDVYQKDADVILPSGLTRGGGREMVLVLACDAIICISGGSGTLTEMAIAYQADIPMIGMKGFGGWTDRLTGQFIDARNRRKVLLAQTPEEAVRLAIREGEDYRKRFD